jgi:hypothetical protein
MACFSDAWSLILKAAQMMRIKSCKKMYSFIIGVTVMVSSMDLELLQ